MTLANGLLGEIWIYVAGRYRGKTTLMIKDTKNVPNDRLYYNEFHGDSWNTARRLKRKFMSHDDFLEFVSTLRDCVVVFEDASAIFKLMLSKKAIEVLARCRNEGVTILMAFHSFRKIPNDILDMIDGLVIFGTEDKEHHVIAKTDNPKVLEAFHIIRKSGNFHEFRRIRFIPKKQKR